MSLTERIITKFQVIITPVINDIQENGTIPIHLNTSIENKAPVTTIKLRADWSMVAAHPIFSVEYQDYIRNSFENPLLYHVYFVF